jgi:stage III sporulation protein AA
MIPPELLHMLAPRLAQLIGQAAPLAAPIEEIRIRQGRPLHLIYHGGDRFLTPDGRGILAPEGAYLPTHDDLIRTFALLAQGSVYAWEDEVRSGFLTVQGGHRVGLAGRVVTEEGKIRTLKQVASLNIRIAREVKGSATPLLPRITRAGRLLSTILISPPQAGKTTLLRDIIRQLSLGSPAWRGLKVGLVDERSEVAGCCDGVPQRDVGPRTDVLDACPKAEGMMLLIRAMSPDVVAVDEIGRPADGDAVMEALHAGVAVLATAHGASLAEVARRPAIKALVEAGAFARAVILGRSRGPGTIEQVHDLTIGGPALGGDQVAG